VRSAPLDGVRALAVVAVLLYHAHYGWAVGGYLGVDVFFVLSGYLITGVLLSTHRSWWGYRQFLVRRAVRLVPALAVAMAGVTAVALLTGLHAPVARCGTTSLTYLMNLPFADRLRCPAMWHITWSLAAEQQFYVVWPLLLAGLALVLRRVRPVARRVGATHPADVRRRGLVGAAVVALALYGSSVLWQVVQRSHGDVPTAALAYGPFGRSLVLLLGCALALWGASRRSRRAPTPRRADAAALGGAVLLVLCVLTGELGPGLGDLWPLLGAALGSLGLVWGAARPTPGSLTQRLLGAAPVAWLGRVSYSLYLWHEVAYRLAEQVAPRGTPLAEVLRFALAVVLAAASFYAVEQPVQRWWSGRRVRETEPAKALVSA
jgi:peptidoglycan/LPS O-acetylase OafA/YrhL